MPVSKRDKKVSLTKTTKKTGNKPKYIERVRSLVSNYKYIYVISFENSRNARLTELRQELTDSVFLFGKNKVIAVAFGRDKSTQLKPGLRDLNKYIKGQCALLFSNRELDDLRDVFNQYRCQDYARPGSIAAQTVILGAGPVPRFPHTLEPPLRQLGLPIKLVRGIINLECDYSVCQLGQSLTPEQCRILKYFEVQTSEFRVYVMARWSAEDGSVDDVSETDAANVITSLATKVKILCQKLDDGLFYFVPEPVNDEESTTMET
uniref:Ribosome assembly factor mrt4 n=1 Tax=Mesocestoides corti TaxID=53468 RepID=A0A5K3FL33_MESCO